MSTYLEDYEKKKYQFKSKPTKANQTFSSSNLQTGTRYSL